MREADMVKLVILLVLFGAVVVLTFVSERRAAAGAAGA
jgi:hypothetical protein